MEMLWIPRLIIVVLCVYGNSGELEEKVNPWWWDDIFGDGFFRDKVDEDVSFLDNQSLYIYQHEYYLHLSKIF